MEDYQNNLYVPRMGSRLCSPTSFVLPLFCMVRNYEYMTYSEVLSKSIHNGHYLHAHTTILGIKLDIMPVEK